MKKNDQSVSFGGVYVAGKSEKTKAHILQTAMQTFGDSGYRQVSMNSIAQQAGVAKGTLYLYYKSKEELYLECVRECYLQIYEYMSRTCEPKGTEVEQILCNYYTLFNDFCCHNPILANLYFSTFFHPVQNLAEQVKAAAAPMVEFSRLYLKNSLKNLLVKDTVDINAVADVMVGVGLMFVQKNRQECWLSKKDEFYQLQEQFKKMIEILLYGILK